MISKETKKRVIGYLDRYSRITSAELAKIGRMGKEEAFRILEAMVRDRLLVASYSDELEKTYKLNGDLDSEIRDILDELRK